MRQVVLNLLIMLLLLVMNRAQGQPPKSALPSPAGTNLAGFVTNEKGLPLAGVIVIIEGTSTGTITLANGHFSLGTNQLLPLTLNLSLMGYRQQTLMVKGNNFRALRANLVKETTLISALGVLASRLPEDIRKAAVTVEKLGASQFANSPAASPFDALQNVKGVDFLTQSLTLRSVNTRGFGANENSRLLQLTDGMDNRSPGLGFGLGNVAGLPDLDVASIELVPGASSARYGPDAVQGLLLTTSKNPFTNPGLSARVTVGLNNAGKTNFGPKGYADMAIRYATRLGERMAVKASFQRLTGTDFLADDYRDRQTRDRFPFWATVASPNGVATGIAYRPNNDPNTNFEYDGVNTYGDEVAGNQSLYQYPADYGNRLLQNKRVTRTGYREIDLLGNNGQVFNNRANVSLHYKVGRQLEASVGWYYGNGNFISTANYRNYVPNYTRHQIKAELKGNIFWLRAYATRQNAQGWNLGQMAAAINNAWKPTGQWASEFGQVYVENKVTVGQARNAADNGRYRPGSAPFERVRNLFANTWNTDSVPGFGAKGLRFRDNSALWHYEGQYNLTTLLNNAAEVVLGGSIRHYAFNTGGTAIALKADGSEYTIGEYGAYVQAAKEIRLSEAVIVKPAVAVRYDKNQYLAGVFSPRVSTVVSIGAHTFRGSWQRAFHNPLPAQLFGAPPAGNSGVTGGLPLAAQMAGLVSNRAYLSSDAADYTASRLTADQLLKRTYDLSGFTTEKVRTWEAGYKTLINNRLAIDAFYFRSRYADVISAQTFYQLLTPGGGPAALANPANYRTLQINVNDASEIFVRGAGIGLDYDLGRSFTLSGNFAHQVGTITLRDAQGNIRPDNAGLPIVNRRMSDPAVAQQGRNFFMSPENRFNISLSNPRISNRIGATLIYHRTGKMWVEQGITAGDVWLPAWTSIDAQLSYTVPSLRSVVKLGGTNLFNQYYAQGYGLARIGGLYYVSITFDELTR